MNLLAFLQTIAEDLGDWVDQGGPMSHQRWSLQTLASYYNEAMCAIATTYRPKQFMAVVETTLQAGSVHDLHACGAELVRVLEVSNGGTTQTVDQTTKSDKDWGALWKNNGMACTTSAAAPTYTVTKVPGATTVVRIEPPVAAGQVKVKALMSGVPPAQPGFTDDVASCKYLAAVRNYVMATALAGQLESQVSLAHSADFMKRFMALMQAQKVAEVEAASVARPA